MAAIVTNKFRLKNAKAFINNTSLDLGSLADVYYMFIGRPQEWANNDSFEAPVDSVNHEILALDDMMAMKRITESNLCHSIVRRRWANNRNYDIYRHDYNGTTTGVSLTGATTTPSSLAEANYFVITANNNVYICINNNNNSSSTVSPDDGVADASMIYTCADGYKWKFVARASSTDLTSFLTLDYYPVRTIEVDPGAGSPYADQWASQVQSKADAGAIFNIILNNGGSGYSYDLGGGPLNTGTNISGIASVTGNGTDCDVTVDMNNGVITRINIVNYGRNYTFAKVSFTGGTGASATAIITPPKGLGADPVSDLNAFNVTVNTRFDYDEDGVFPASNDYRRIGLVVNPKLYSSDARVTATRASAMTTLVLQNPINTELLVADSIVEDSTTGVKAVVIGTRVVGANLEVRVIRTFDQNSDFNGTSYQFGVGHSVKVGEVVVGTIASIANPTVDKYSGDLIYIENRTPIIRSSQQVENFKTVFEF